MTELELIKLRLATLERRNVLLRITIGTIGLVLVCVVLAGAGATPKPKILEAEGFLLKDHRGETRAALDFSPFGSPTLRFFDKDKMERINLGLLMLERDEPRLVMSDSKGRFRLSNTFLFDNPELWLSNTDMKSGAGLMLNRAVAGRGGSLMISDDKTKANLTLTVHDGMVTQNLDSRGQNAHIGVGLEFTDPSIRLSVGDAERFHAP